MSAMVSRWFAGGFVSCALHLRSERFSVGLTVMHFNTVTCMEDAWSQSSTSGIGWSRCKCGTWILLVEWLLILVVQQ